MFFVPKNREPGPRALSILRRFEAKCLVTRGDKSEAGSLTRDLYMLL